MANLDNVCHCPYILVCIYTDKMGYHFRQVDRCKLRAMSSRLHRWHIGSLNSTDSLALLLNSITVKTR